MLDSGELIFSRSSSWELPRGRKNSKYKRSSQLPINASLESPTYCRSFVVRPYVLAALLGGWHHFIARYNG